MIITIISFTLQVSIGQDQFVFLKASSLEELEKIEQFQSSTSGTLNFIFGFVLLLAYELIFYVNYEGATPGKRLMAIKVAREDGAKLTYSVAFIRYLVEVVSSFAFGLGYFWVIWDKKKQGWHDKIANTLVVKTEARPKTCLGLTLTIIAVLSVLSFFGLMFYKGIELGVEQARRETGGFAGKSIREFLEKMSPEAKIHWDRSQELFKQMRVAADDPEQVRKLNDENIQELKKALEIEPNNHRIWTELGHAYTWVSTTATLEDMLSAYKKAEELDPENVVYINEVGDELIRMGRYDEAILQFQKTLRITDKSGLAHLSLGTAYKNSGIKESAKEHFQKAIEIFTAENKNGSYDDEIPQVQKELAGLENQQ